MALTPSNSLAKGAPAAQFSLTDTVSGELISLTSIQGSKGTVVLFICNHCPFVLHINAQLVQLAKDYTAQGIGFVAISSNDVVHYPQDGPEFMKTHAEEVGYPFPYLYDETQEVAKAYDAACTPDIYVFDAALAAVYHGQIDDSRPGNGVPVTGKDLRGVLDALVAGVPYTGPEKPSMGCNIKWK